MKLQTSSLTHEWIWRAIDSLARHKQLTASGLARLAGLDPTTFNRSKRFTADGRPRWPSTESISKILRATGVSLDEFITLPDVSTSNMPVTVVDPDRVPLIGQICDETLNPLGEGPLAGTTEDELAVPVEAGRPFAVEVADSSLEPVYRCGLTLVATAGTILAPGDRVLIKPRRGRAMPRLLIAASLDHYRLQSMRPDGGHVDVPRDDVMWLARIIWSSG